MQVLKLGENLPEMELLLPRGGGIAFALDMTEPDGTPTVVTGPVELVVDGGHVWGGVVEVIDVLNDVEVAPNTPGATQVSRVLFTLDGGDTIQLAYGPHRGGVRYTPAGSGPLIIAKGLVTAQ